MGCLSKAAVVSYLAGDLSGAEHAVAEVHLESCVNCMGLISELTQAPEVSAEIASSGGFIQAVTQKNAVSDRLKSRSKLLKRKYGLALGDIVDQKYRIDEILGEGGMGIVLLGTHLALRERVALKFMQPSMAADDGHAARFAREARAAVKLRHENVARVIDYGETEESGPYIAMEYLEGQDLMSLLKERAPFSVAESVELIRQTANGLAAIHDSGIVHRDIKPGNLFVAKESGGRRTIKVLDFGVAKYTDGDSLQVTGTNMVIGSPMYMAPEMFTSARNASYSSDVWALGVIFYRMLTGRLPFYAESLPETVAKILFEKPTPLSHWRPDYPDALVQIVQVCLRREGSERFASAREFLHALAQLPADIQGDALAPSVEVTHLSSSASLPVVDNHPPARAAVATIADSPASSKPRTAPWVLVLAGFAASALLFAGIMMATRGDTKPEGAAKVSPDGAEVDEAETAGRLDGHTTVLDASPPKTPPPTETMSAAETLDAGEIETDPVAAGAPVGTKALESPDASPPVAKKPLRKSRSKPRRRVDRKWPAKDQTKPTNALETKPKSKRRPDVDSLLR